MLTFTSLGNYGRLGNQMFQIASTIGIGEKNGHNFSFPVWSYSDYFKNPLPQYTQLQPNSQTYVVNEPTRRYYDLALKPDDGILYILEGYFQSWKYFDHCQELIRYHFEPNFETNDLFTDVAVHVRRGDYIDLSHIHTNLWEESYYQRAMDLFPDSKFTIFSDDISWCMENFDHDKCYFMLPASDDIKTDDITQMFYMSKHPNMIIANSSFSWWAAYLNKNEDKKIIAPSIWVNNESGVDDRVLPEWIVV